jgi:hypothetical protein
MFHHSAAAPFKSPQHQASYNHYSADNAGLSSTSTSAASTSTSTTTSSSHHRRTERANASRSPSLSHSAESRLSSPDLARTPDDERRLSELSLSDSNSSSRQQQGLLLPPMKLKRKANSSHEFEEEEGRSSSKRISPSRQLPSLSSNLLPPSQQQQHNLHHHHIQHRSASPKSLQHILNEELRPLSLSGFRVATSDVRSSSSDEDELDEDA